MKELRAIVSWKRVNELNIRNGPILEDLLALPIGSEVRVWRKNLGWQGPCKILERDVHNVRFDMIN